MFIPPTWTLHLDNALDYPQTSPTGFVDADMLASYNNPSAGVAESADAADLKSAGAILVGSSPTPGTSSLYHPTNCPLNILSHQPILLKKLGKLA